MCRSGNCLQSGYKRLLASGDKVSNVVEFRPISVVILGERSPIAWVVSARPSAARPADHTHSHTPTQWFSRSQNYHTNTLAGRTAKNSSVNPTRPERITFARFSLRFMGRSFESFSLHKTLLQTRSSSDDRQNDRNTKPLCNLNLRGFVSRRSNTWSRHRILCSCAPTAL